MLEIDKAHRKLVKENRGLLEKHIKGLIISWAPFLGLPMSSFHRQVFGSSNYQKQIISLFKVVPGS